jgi:TM2 domain-containing membrane protein YozV
MSRTGIAPGPSAENEGDCGEDRPAYTLGALKEEESAEKIFGGGNLWEIPRIREEAEKGKISPHERKNPVHAAVLSLFFPGLGQIYNGENFKGFLVFFWTLAGLIIILPGVFVWAYGIYDARAVALKMNSGVVPYRKMTPAVVVIYCAMVVVVILIVLVLVLPGL